MMSIRRKPREVPLSRFGRAQKAYRQGTSAAAGRIVPAAHTMRDSAAKGVLAVRGRSAPWLREAGTYVAADLGPLVGGMLSNAAQRMEPQHRPVRRRRNAAMMMVGAVSAVGLAGALLTRRGDTRAMPYIPSGPRTESVPSDVDGRVRAMT